MGSSRKCIIMGVRGQFGKGLGLQMTSIRMTNVWVRGQMGWYYWSSEVSEIKQCFIKNIILKIIIRYRLARQLAS